MKKRILGVMALACCMISPVVLTSCGDDDDKVPSKEEQKEEQFGKYAHTEATYDLELTEATDSLCYATVKYTDEDGNMKSEDVWSGKWEKRVITKKPLSECHYEVYLHKKDGVDLTENNPLFQHTEESKDPVAKIGTKSGNITAISYDENGKRISGRSKDLATTLTMTADMAVKFFEKYKDTAFRTASVNFNNEGLAD